MELKEIIAEIVQKKFSALPETQRPRALAKVLDVGEMDARRLIDAGRNQEKQFAISRKVLSLCAELDINPAQDLSDAAASQQTKEMHDVTRIIKRHRTGEVSKEVAAGSVHKITQRGKKHFPPGQAHGNQGRKSRQD